MKDRSSGLACCIVCRAYYRIIVTDLGVYYVRLCRCR